MTSAVIDPRIRAGRIVAWLAVALAAIGLAWYWAEQWRDVANVATAQKAATPTIDLAQSVRTAAAARAFGAEAPRQKPAETAPVVAESNLKVRGIYALQGGVQMAIVDSGEGDRAVRVGTEIAQGVTLVAVAPSHVVVERGGRREKILIDFSGKDRPVIGAPIPRPGASVPGAIPVPGVAPVPGVPPAPQNPQAADGGGDPGNPGNGPRRRATRPPQPGG